MLAHNVSRYDNHLILPKNCEKKTKNMTFCVLMKTMGDLLKKRFDKNILSANF